MGSALCLSANLGCPKPLMIVQWSLIAYLKPAIILRIPSDKNTSTEDIYKRTFIDYGHGDMNDIFCWHRWWWCLTLPLYPCHVASTLELHWWRRLGAIVAMMRCSVFFSRTQKYYCAVQMLFVYFLVWGDLWLGCRHQYTQKNKLENRQPTNQR